MTLCSHYRSRGRNSLFPILSLLLTVLLCGVANADSTLSITGLDDTRYTLDKQRIDSLNSEDITATSHGETLTYQTVKLLDVLQQLSVVPADKLTREHMTMVVEVISKDGYRAVFSLAELDPAIGHRAVHIAYGAMGEALPGAMGHWRLIVPEDIRHARWVWDVAEIKVYKL